MTVNTLDDNVTFWSPYYTVVENAEAGFGIISGCAISKGSGDWDIDVTSGTTLVTGTGEVSVGSGTVTISDSSGLGSGESRIDLITADSGGALAGVEGTGATNPDAPDVPTDEVILGFVVVADTDNTAADSDIIDVPVLVGDDSARYKDGGSHELDAADLAGGDGTAGQVLETDGSAATWQTVGTSVGADDSLRGTATAGSNISAGQSETYGITLPEHITSDGVNVSSDLSSNPGALDFTEIEVRDQDADSWVSVWTGDTDIDQTVSVSHTRYWTDRYRVTVTNDGGSGQGTGRDYRADPHPISLT